MLAVVAYAVALIPPPRETFGNSQLDKGLRYESKMRSELEDPVGDLASILMWN